MAIIPITSESHWHALRSQHIGASEIQALLIEDDKLAISSDDSFTTANQLYMMKRGLINGVEVTPIMEFGNVMEPIIGHMIAAENDWTIQKAHEYHEHPDHPQLGCTLDYYALETPEGPVLLQIKNVVHTSHKWTQNRATPYVEMQVQQELDVVNAARKAEGLEPFAAHCIGSMHKGNPEDIRLMFRTAMPEVVEAIHDASARFWADVQAGREPDITNPKDYEHILELVKKAEKIERTVDLTDRPDLDEVVVEYNQAKARRLAAEKEESALKAKLLRQCLQIEDNGDMCVHTLGLTPGYELNVNEILVNYKAKEASTGKQTRFTVKGRKF